MNIHIKELDHQISAQEEEANSKTVSNLKADLCRTVNNPETNHDVLIRHRWEGKGQKFCIRVKRGQ